MARRLEARPGPAFTPWASCPALASINAETAPNFARNSPATVSNIEFRSLELQRFRTLLKLRPIELRARFRGRGSSPQWCANWCIGCLFGATRCRVETAITFARPKCVCGIVGEQRCRWFHAYPRTSEQRRFHLGAKKFALWRCVIAKARKSSPCALKTPQIRRSCACWASFFAERPLEGPCWASFFAEGRWRGRAGRILSRLLALRSGERS